MSKQTDKSLFIFPPSLIEHAGFYQDLLKGVASYYQLGNRLIKDGEQAHAFRHFDKVKEAGQLLSHIPVRVYQSIGHYFLAVAENSKGSGDQQQARKLFETAADTAPAQYKAKSILSLAAVSFNTGDFKSAFYHYQEVIKAGQLSPIGIQAIRGMALLKSIEGYHHHALKDLESILPIARYAPSHIYFDYLNSLAVELGEVGRKDEARNVINHVLASPYASAYPEWLQTAGDLQPSSRSFVAIKSSPVNAENLLSMPAIEHAEPIKQAIPARVINLQQWKAKMSKNETPKDETPNDRKPNEDLDDRELTLRIFQLVSTGNRTEAELFDILNAIEKILAEHKAKE